MWFWFVDVLVYLVRIPFSLPSTQPSQQSVSVIICNSDYLYYEKRKSEWRNEDRKIPTTTTREDDGERKKIVQTHRGTQSIVAPLSHRLHTESMHIHFTRGSYIEFLIRFSIEWHFINLFYLSSLFRLALSLSVAFLSFIFPFSV